MFRLLLWVHWRTLRAWVRGTRRDSPLLLGFLFLLIAGYLGLGFWLFHAGLDYLYHFPVFGSLLLQRMLFLVFGFFFGMLVFSNLIIAYTTLFRNRETAWFLTLPIPTRRIFQWKFFEALAVSSWALIFLSAPLMLAYGLVYRVGPAFFVKVAALYLPFVVLPAVAGVTGSIFLARIFQTRWFRLALMWGGVAAMVALIAGLRPVSEAEAVRRTDAASLDAILQHTRLSLNPWLPSAWVTRAILAWSGGLERQGAFYFLLVLSNALMGLMVVFEAIGRLFHGSWAATYATRAARTEARSAARRVAAQRPSLAERMLRPLRRWSPPAAALVLKDARLFWRDPAQWSQFLIFFGLLCIYVANLRNVVATFSSPFWEVLISYLNLAACALTLSTLTTRFVFPQFSLEGRRIWILGLAPFGLQRVLLQKFWLAWLTTLAITATMMLTSCLLLHLPAGKIVFFLAAITAMSAALCGLSTGLGAIFPNFKEDNPSKIVSGFGGTVCLVISFLFIVLFITLLALPDLLRVTGQAPGLLSPLARALAAALSAAVLFFPLLGATARVKRLEI